MDHDDIAGSRRCPTCEAPAQRRFRPFCSKRCQDLDLGHWLRGSYRIPTEEAPAEGLAEGEDDDDIAFGPFGGNA
jgi:endogenous inhibitor of DNA gyrase (YacG/DUF329 family)